MERGENRPEEHTTHLVIFGQEGRSSGEERVGIPINIEARLAEMDAARGRAVDIETPLYRAPDIMDDRLTELHAEIGEKGDQASRDLMDTLDFTYKMFYIFELRPEKRVTYFRVYQAMREEHPEEERYYFSAEAQRNLNSVLDRAGLGKAWWYGEELEGVDYTLPYPDADFIETNYLPDEEEVSRYLKTNNIASRVTDIKVSEVTED